MQQKAVIFKEHAKSTFQGGFGRKEITIRTLGDDHPDLETT